MQEPLSRPYRLGSARHNDFDSPPILLSCNNSSRLSSYRVIAMVWAATLHLRRLAADFLAALSYRGSRRRVPYGGIREDNYAATADRCGEVTG